ncbi:MAG: hypothetical protein PVH01_18370 [Desulfobacterales bacterium]
MKLKHHKCTQLCSILFGAFYLRFFTLSAAAGEQATTIKDALIDDI